MKRISRISQVALFVFAGTLFSACASVPPHNSNVDEAHSAYDAASTDPVIMQSAPEQMQKASSSLNRADELLKKGAPESEVDHYAYLARLRVEIAKQKAETDSIQAKIKKAGAERDKYMLEAKQNRIARLREQLANLKAKKTDRGLVLTLGSVLFDLNRASLKSGGIKNVNRLARFMQSDPKRNVMIEGYTDSTGSPEYNKKLSKRRADAVRDALIKDGINPQRIVTKGFGKDYPVASNKTAEGRQENRRVEVVISDENGNFPGIR
ncbi:MAG: OmpA family protein [Nitrospirae bacterium]|nr:OmpA family protein [Nitrospirota bacterium]MCL5285215.1 OmpA family protein [Nitrospirota bacterium]